MSLIDVIQFVSVSISIAVIIVWVVRLRRWPITIAVIVAMLANVGFYISRTFNLFSPVDLNLFSSVRVLLMVIVLAAIPFSLERDK